MAVAVSNMLQLYASLLHERRILLTTSKLNMVRARGWERGARVGRGRAADPEMQRWRVGVTGLVPGGKRQSLVALGEDKGWCLVGQEKTLFTPGASERSLMDVAVAAGGKWMAPEQALPSSQGNTQHLNKEANFLGPNPEKWQRQETKHPKSKLHSKGFSLGRKCRMRLG